LSKKGGIVNVSAAKNDLKITFEASETKQEKEEEKN
jgi:hypothetical protein